MNLCPALYLQVEDRNGRPLSGGLVHTYIAGSVDPAITYKDAGLSIENSNPIILNSAGIGDVRLDPTRAYKFVITESDGTPFKTIDNITSPDAANVGTVPLPPQTVLGNVTGSLTEGYPVPVESDLSGAANENIPNVQAVRVALTDYLENSGTNTYTGDLNIVGSITENGEAIDKKTVKVSEDDTTPGFLGAKIVGGGDITVETINEGGNEQILISADIPEDTHTVKVSTDDTTPSFLSNKITASGSVSITIDGAGGDEILNIDVPEESHTVKVNSSDTTPNFLVDKLRAGENITLTVIDDEEIEISANADSDGTLPAISVWKNSGSGPSYTPVFPFPMNFSSYEEDNLGSEAAWSANTSKLTATVAGYYMVECQCNVKVSNALADMHLVKLDFTGAETSDFVQTRILSSSTTRWDEACYTVRGLFNLSENESVQFGYKNVSDPARVYVNDITFSAICLKSKGVVDGGVEGTGTTNRLTKWTSPSTLGDALLQENVAGDELSGSLNTMWLYNEFNDFERFAEFIINLSSTLGSESAQTIINAKFADGEQANYSLRVAEDLVQMYMKAKGADGTTASLDTSNGLTMDSVRNFFRTGIRDEIASLYLGGTGSVVSAEARSSADSAVPSKASFYISADHGDPANPSVFDIEFSASQRRLLMMNMGIIFNDDNAGNSFCLPRFASDPPTAGVVVQDGCLYYNTTEKKSFQLVDGVWVPLEADLTGVIFSVNGIGPDGTGDVTITAGDLGAVEGTGTVNTLPLWTPDGTTLGDSKVSQDASGNVFVDANTDGDHHLEVGAITVNGGVDGVSDTEINLSYDGAVTGSIKANAQSSLKKGLIASDGSIGSTEKPLFWQGTYWVLSGLTGQNYYHVSTNTNAFPLTVSATQKGFYYTLRLDFRDGVPSSVSLPVSSRWIGSEPVWEDKEYIIRIYNGDDVLYFFSEETGAGGSIDYTKFPYIPQTTPPSDNEGTTYYDDNKKSLVLRTGSGSDLELGREGWARCYNNTASIITSGSAVYLASGEESTGEVFSIASLASATAKNTCTFVGIATQDIPIGGYGEVATFGMVRDIDTDDFANGGILYVSTTAGVLTNAPPPFPNFECKVGRVLKTSSTEGVLFVDPDVDPPIGSGGTVDAGLATFDLVLCGAIGSDPQGLNINNSQNQGTYISTRVIPRNNITLKTLSIFVSQAGSFGGTGGLRLGVYALGAGGDTLIEQTEKITSLSIGINTLDLDSSVSLLANGNYFFALQARALNGAIIGGRQGLAFNAPNHFGRYDGQNAPSIDTTMIATAGYSQTNKQIWISGA